MFFKTKRNRRKTTRQTLHTEQLEPKAMFSVSPVEPVVALDVGPVNQASVEDCMVIEPVFNVGENSRMIVHPQYNVGENGRMIIHPQFNVGEDGRMIIHPQFNVGEDGRSIVHPQYNVGGSADPGGDDIFMPKPNRGVSLHDSVHCLVGDIGKAPFTTGAGGDSIVHPEFMTGVNSLAQANQQPQIASVWTQECTQAMAPRHIAFARMGR